MGQDIIAPANSRNNIRKIARSFRAQIGCETLLPFPIVRFVEQGLPQIWEDYSFEVKENWKMPTEEGRAFPEQKTIWVREDVYIYLRVKEQDTIDLHLPMN